MTDEKQAFKEKLRSIQFGMVRGGYRDLNSTTSYDKEAMLQQLGHPDGRGSAFSKERVEDARSDATRRIKEYVRDAG